MAAEIASYIKVNYEYEYVEDLTWLTPEDVDLMAAALELKRGSVEKLQEAIKAAQVRQFVIPVFH